MKLSIVDFVDLGFQIVLSMRPACDGNIGVEPPGRFARRMADLTRLHPPPASVHDPPQVPATTWNHVWA